MAIKDLENKYVDKVYLVGKEPILVNLEKEFYTPKELADKFSTTVKEVNRFIASMVKTDSVNATIIEKLKCSKTKKGELIPESAVTKDDIIHIEDLARELNFTVAGTRRLLLSAKNIKIETL